MIQTLLQTIEETHQLTAGELSTRSRPESLAGANADIAVLHHTVELGLPRIGGLLPIENANDVVGQMCERIPLREIGIPVFAGICGTEPVRYFSSFFRHLADLGVSGVQNFPSIGLIDGGFRYNLESVRLGTRCEEKMLALAMARGLEVLPFVYNQYEALAMAKLGARIVVLDLGFCSQECDIRAELAQYLDRIQSVSALLRSVYPDVRLLIYSMYEEIAAQLRAAQLTCVDRLYRSVRIE